MATFEADVGTELTLIKGGEGIRSLPESVPASEWRDWCLVYERERARADEAEARAEVAEAHAEQWRRAEIAARTVIAYQLVQVIRKTLAKRADGELKSASWTTLRRVLGARQRVTATFKRADGRTLHVRKATVAEPNQQAILDALGIPKAADGGTCKMIV